VSWRPRRNPLPVGNRGIAFSTKPLRRPICDLEVFCATMVAQRERLGEQVTDWIAQNPLLNIVDVIVTQSSDAQFHCIAITVFYWEPIARRS
jgi:hypothetical protein